MFEREKHHDLADLVATLPAGSLNEDGVQNLLDEVLEIVSPEQVISDQTLTQFMKVLPKEVSDSVSASLVYSSATDDLGATNTVRLRQLQQAIYSFSGRVKRVMTLASGKAAA